MVDRSSEPDPGRAGVVFDRGLVLLEMLSARAGGVTPAVCLAIAGAGAGLAVMISGYMSGGQKGLVLCGALSGLVVAALVLRWSMRGTRPLGVGIVAFYSLIVIGRFLGELSVLHAIVLAGSPLLAWVPELPLVRRLPRLARELRACSWSGWSLRRSSQVKSGNLPATRRGLRIRSSKSLRRKMT